MPSPRTVSLAVILVVAFLLVGCSSQPATTEPYLCPEATPEWLRVEPVTSPTDQLSQTISVQMGNMEAVTITAESGIFSSTEQQVEVALLPDTIHYLQVAARVREIWRDGCQYGGYTLRTTKDRNGDPLVIQQGQPTPSE